MACCHGPKANPNGWSCKHRWPTGRISFTRPTKLLASSTERCRPVDPRVPALPSKLLTVLLRGIGSASFRFGEFWVHNGLLPRAESESERLVVQTSLVHSSFFLHSAQESSGVIHRSLSPCRPSRSRPSFETFSRVVTRDRGHFLPFRRILGDQWLVATERKRIRTAGRANFVGPLVPFFCHSADGSSGVQPRALPSC